MYAGISILCKHVAINEAVHNLAVFHLRKADHFRRLSVRTASCSPEYGLGYHIPLFLKPCPGPMAASEGGKFGIGSGSPVIVSVEEVFQVPEHYFLGLEGYQMYQSDKGGCEYVFQFHNPYFFNPAISALSP